MAASPERGWWGGAYDRGMSFGWIKLHYVLLYAVIGAYLPYMPVYLNRLGLADWQIGWVLGVYGVAVLAMPALLTHLADTRLTNRMLIGIGYAIAAVALAGVSQVSVFGALIGLSLLFSVGYTPMFSLVDGMTFSAMHREEEAGRRPPPYHRVRIWGSIGFMVPSVIIWAVLRYAGLSTTAAILTAAGAAAIASVTAHRLPATGAVEPGQAKAPTLHAWRSLRRPAVLSLVGPLVLLFLAIAIFYAFYTRYLQELGVGGEWMGLIVNIGVAAEIVLMLFAARFLHLVRLKGVMVLGAVAMVVRLGLLAAVPTVGVALATQVLHAPIVMALYLVPPMYLNAKADRRYRNSMQGLYSVLCFGVARLAGSAIGGYLAEYDLRLALGFGCGLGVAAAGWLVLGFRDDEACADIRRRSLATAA